MSKRFPPNADDVSHTKRPKTDPITAKQGALELPAHWKSMTGLSARFSVFKHESAGSCDFTDSSFACDVLQNAFMGRLDLGAYRRVGAPDSLVVGDGASACAAPSQKKKKSPSKGCEKDDMTHLTVCSPEQQEEVGVSPKSDGPFVVVLREMLKQLDTKMIRILEIEQLQNIQSFMMQKTFVEANCITEPYETVYHGTDESAIHGIVSEGLRAMYSKRSRFGRGTYVSRSFEVACGFASADEDGVRHIIVVHCQIGCIKQLDVGETTHDFYTMSSDGKEKILNHTKEVVSENYLIMGSDSQMICHALIKVQDADFNPPDGTRTSNPPPSAQTSQQLHNSSMSLFMNMITTMNTASNAQIKRMHQSLGLGGAGSSGFAGPGASDAQIMQMQQTLGLAGVGGVGGASAIGSGGTALGGAGAALGGGANLLVGNINTKPPVLMPYTVAADNLAGALAEIKRKRQEKLAGMSCSMVVMPRTEEEDNAKAKAAKLLACQAPLPAANIDLPSTRVLCKNDTVSLYNMGKADLHLQGQEGVIKLIVRECIAKGNKHVIMVELKDASMFASITLANQRRETKNKNTGFSRYGSLMKEHYVLCRYSQIDGSHAVIAPASDTL